MTDWEQRARELLEQPGTISALMLQLAREYADEQLEEAARAMADSWGTAAAHEVRSFKSKPVSREAVLEAALRLIAEHPTSDYSRNVWIAKNALDWRPE